MFYFQSHISRASCEGKSCNPRSGISWISSLFVKSQFQGYFQALFPEPNTKRSISRAKVKMGKAAIHGLEYPKYYLYLGNQFQRYIQVRFPFPETKSRWERPRSLVLEGGWYHQRQTSLREAMDRSLAQRCIFYSLAQRCIFFYLNTEWIWNDCIWASLWLWHCTKLTPSHPPPSASGHFWQLISVIRDFSKRIISERTCNYCNFWFPILGYAIWGPISNFDF